MTTCLDLLHAAVARLLPHEGEPDADRTLVFLRAAILFHLTWPCPGRRCVAGGYAYEVPQIIGPEAA